MAEQHECAWCGYPNFRSEHAANFPCTSQDFQTLLEWDRVGLNVRYRDSTRGRRGW